MLIRSLAISVDDDPVINRQPGHLGEAAVGFDADADNDEIGGAGDAAFADNSLDLSVTGKF